jgi:hypothetical protein
MSDLSIEKGVPMPQRGGWGRFGDVVHQMEVGDSILVTKQNDVCNIQTQGRRIGLTMSSRKVDSGWRVWRIK